MHCEFMESIRVVYSSNSVCVCTGGIIMFHVYSHITSIHHSLVYWCMVRECVEFIAAVPCLLCFPGLFKEFN